MSLALSVDQDRLGSICTHQYGGVAVDASDPAGPRESLRSPPPQVHQDRRDAPLLSVGSRNCARGPFKSTDGRFRRRNFIFSVLASHGVIKETEVRGSLRDGFEMLVRAKLLNVVCAVLDDAERLGRPVGTLRLLRGPLLSYDIAGSALTDHCNLQMVIMSIVFAWAFSYKEYKAMRAPGAKHTSVWRSFLHSLNYCGSRSLVERRCLSPHS